MISRKKFLQNLSVSSLALVAPTSFAQQSTSSTSKSAVKITDVKAYAADSATYVKIETDAGVSGWGEGDHFSTPIVAKIITDILKPKVIGQDPFDSEYLWTQMFFEGFEGGNSGFVPGAVAGVDNALWDLKGRLLKMPVSKLLGGSKLEKVAVYGSYGRKKKGGLKSVEEMVNEGVAFVEQGYKTIKARMQLYDRGRNPADNFTYECIKAIRKAVGDDITIFVDFNNGYTAGKAIELGLKLYEQFNIQVVEEPVSSMDYPGLRQVVEALPCDVNAGEHEYNKWQFRDLITIGNPDCLNLDTIKCSGITECRKIAAMGHAFEKEVMVHNTRPTLATAASLNLLGAIPNAAKVQEFSGMRPELNLSQFFHNSLKFENGFLFIPMEPGLGLEVNEKTMEKFRVK
ncbi:MAG: mandelate racemase/muconate lactonizing enzyme family protein [Cyclobacteriaceae bacterium]|nr:mandelate racemase/muconate lactonizing enzyme family protein [Cyclobacteriaceae bacterium]UYN85478.1 MAG: mandelate racemase/muconate lactonizing enzyme family protein [Cyclobacteriaceae bacterium]